MRIPKGMQSGLIALIPLVFIWFGDGEIDVVIFMYCLLTFMVLLDISRRVEELQEEVKGEDD